MNNVDYCDECGGEIVGIICSVCYKRSRITRDIGRTKIYLQGKICDAKKGRKIDSVFYDKDFVKDFTGIEKLGVISCTHGYWNYEKIIKSGVIKRKVPKSVIDMRYHHSRHIYIDKDLRFKKKKVRITAIYMLGIEFFVDIGFSDKDEKDLIVAPGFTSHVWNSKNKKEKKRGEKTKIQKKKTKGQKKSSKKKKT